MSRKLVVNDGRRERELLLIGTMVVGRDPTCDISDADPLLSRRHVEFIASPKEVIVRDLGSRNGILINGVKTTRSVLRGGDVVKVGHLEVRFVDDDAPLVASRDVPSDETALAAAASGRGRSGSPGTTRRPATASRVVAPSGTHVEEPTERVARIASAEATTRFAAPAIRSDVPKVASSHDAPQNMPGAFASAAGFVRTQTVTLAAIVFIATATPLIVWPPAAGDVAIVLAAPLAITMGAVWVTSRRIHRHLSTAFTVVDQASGGARSARSAGRET